MQAWDPPRAKQHRELAGALSPEYEMPGAGRAVRIWRHWDRLASGNGAYRARITGPELPGQNYRATRGWGAQGFALAGAARIPFEPRGSRPRNPQCSLPPRSDNKFEGLALPRDVTRRGARKVCADHQHPLPRQRAKDAPSRRLGCDWVKVGRRRPLGVRHLAGVMGKITGDHGPLAV